MIVAEDKRVIETDGVENIHYFGVDAEDLPHIFSVLRNKMYSNNILACIREYSTNAADAHTLVGQRELPIEVTLPTSYEPVFKIRDFGPGLSFAAIKAVYTKYGKSDKRESNEFNGQLGFGSKAGFAYSDDFQVVSYHKGTKSVYEMFIDATKKGAVVQVSTEPSDAPSGLEITIPVQTKDITEFGRIAGDYYKFFSPRPKVLGRAEPVLERFAEYDNRKWFLEGADWKIGGKGTAKVIMGNVTYPLDASHWYGSPWYDIIARCEVILYAPIGAVLNSASRESLDYNADTKAWIEAKLADIQAEIASEFVQECENAPNIWEAKMVFKRMKYAATELKPLLPKKLSWNSPTGPVEIMDAVLEASKDLLDLATAGVTFKQVTQKTRRRQRSYGYEDGKTVNYAIITSVPVNECAIVIDNRTVRRGDVPFKMAKALAAFGEESKTLYDEHRGHPELTLIQVADVETEQLVRAHPALAGANFVNLETFEGSKPKASSRYNADLEQAKCKIFAYNGRGGYRDKKSDAWDIITDMDLKNGSGVYVRINNFEIVSGSGLGYCGSDVMNDFVRAFAPFLPDGVLYGIRATVDETRIGSGWVSLADMIAPAILEYFTANNLFDVYATWKYIGSHSVSDFYKSLARTTIHEQLKSGPLKRMLTILHEVNASESKYNLASFERFVLNRLNSKPDISGAKTTIDFAKLTEAAEARYPFLSEMAGQFYLPSIEHDEKVQAKFVKYANAF